MTEPITWPQVQIKIRDLIDYKHNPRTITKIEFDKLVNSLKTDGYHNRIKIDADNVIIGGDKRRKALLAAGYGLDDVIEVLQAPRKLSDDEFKRLNIQDNTHAGVWDIDILANHFEHVDLQDWGIPDGLLQIAEPLIEAEEDEPIPEPDISKTPIVKLGDVWTLGQHRLMCGDSTEPDDIIKLVNNTKIDFIYTDAPYGISVNTSGTDGTSPVKKRRYTNIIGDQDTNVASIVFNLLTSIFVDCPLVYWGGNYFTHFLRPSKCWIAWNKRAGGMINSFCGTELAYTNCNKHSITFQIVWNGMFRAGESNREPRIHQAQKPIKLALDTFDYLDAGKTVLDLFGGSGTTLIACEKSKRVCYMMEISPHYCDAIIQRWEKLTGLKAIQEMPV